MNNQDILSSLGFSKGIRYELKRKWQWIENLSLATVVGKWWLRRNNPKRSKSADFDKYWPTVTPLVHFASFTSPWSVRLPQESWISVDRLSVFPAVYSSEKLAMLYSILIKGSPTNGTFSWIKPYQHRPHTSLPWISCSDQSEKSSPLHVLPSDMLDTARYSRPWLCLVTMYTGSLPSFPKR